MFMVSVMIMTLLAGWLADRKLWSEVMGGLGGQRLVMGWYGG